MDLIRFRIRHPAGRVDELVTESVRILIGTGSHCEIRLPVGTARVEGSDWRAQATASASSRSTTVRPAPPGW